MPDNTSSLAEAKYVSLTTYKKDGSAVAAPVWISGDGGDLVVITEEASWKVKRLRNDDRVQLAVSDARGRVKAGAETRDGTAKVVSGPEAERIDGLIKEKYGVTARYIIPVYYKLRNLVTRREAAEAAGIVITLAE